MTYAKRNALSKKSILFLIPTLGGGGAERVLTNLVNNLDKNKYDITVQCIFKAGVNSKFLGKHIHFIQGRVKQFSGNVALMKLFSPHRLYKLFIHKRYDIVVSYLEGTTARIVSGCPYSDSKLISWVHVEQHTRKVASYCFRSYNEACKCLLRYDYTICVAESVKDDFVKLFPNVTNCLVLYNTNEDKKIRDLAKEAIDGTMSSEFNVISVGRLTEAKGYDRLIKVHRRLLNEGFKHHIYILGTGDESEINDLIIKEEVTKTFHLLGFQSNPYKFVARADLFVCSSRREGFSTAVTEALILGVPVVTTNCSGSFELCGANEYGFVVSNDEEGIYEGMKTMLSDPKILSHYKTQAEIRGQMFSKDATIQSVEHLLDKMFIQY